VTRILTQAELLRHIRDPAAVIAAGNLRANALFRRYKVVILNPAIDSWPTE
jgi:hypothetical protein